MAKNNSGEDKRNRARENARRIAANQAKKEKTAKAILYVGIGVVIVAVLAVVGVLIFQQSKPAVVPGNYVAGGITVGKNAALVQPKEMPAGESSDLPVPTDAGTKKDAATVTVYIDFQCPACQAFEKTNASMLNKLADEGSIVVNYRPVAFLDRMSGGNEYSTRAANFTACVVDSQPGTAVDLIESLYVNQPEEGGEGRTDEQLLELAQKAGVDTSEKLSSDPEQSVKSCVADQSFAKYVEKSTQDALDDGVQATPWVLINGKQTETTNDAQALATEILKATGEFKD